MGFSGYFDACSVFWLSERTWEMGCVHGKDCSWAALRGVSVNNSVITLLHSERSLSQELQGEDILKQWWCNWITGWWDKFGSEVLLYPCYIQIFVNFSHTACLLWKSTWGRVQEVLAMILHCSCLREGRSVFSSHFWCPVVSFCLSGSQSVKWKRKASLSLNLDM